MLTYININIYNNQRNIINSPKYKLYTLGIHTLMAVHRYINFS